MASNFGIIAALAALFASGSKTEQWKPGSPYPGGLKLEPDQPGPPVTTTQRPTGVTTININPQSTSPGPPATAPVSRHRTWFIKPGDPITGRDPTPEEQDSGLGCPEIPGIWNAEKMNPPARYCSNPNCESNKPYAGVDQGVPPTPARLEIIVDKTTGSWTYHCPVCRTDQ